MNLVDRFWHKFLGRPYTLAKRIDQGKGQPVVFLHGIASNGENWRQIASKLDQTKYRVIVLDLLGFGDSPKPDWVEYSVEDHSRAVLASLRQLGVGTKMILVGHSMGSLVAAYIAAKNPNKIKQLILYQMPIYSDKPSNQNLRHKAYMSTYKYIIEHPELTLWYAKKFGKTAAKVSGFNLDEQTWQPFEMSLKNTIMQQQSLDALCGSHIQTDVVYGKYDIFVMSKVLRQIFKSSDNLRFYEIDDVHRVSERSSVLIYDLITQDPGQKRAINSKHARLIDMHKDFSKSNNTKKTLQSSNKGKYLLLVSSIMLLAWSSYIAAQGLPNAERSLFETINNISTSNTVEIIAKLISNLVWVAAGIVALCLVFEKTRKMAYKISFMAVAVNAFTLVVEHLVSRMRPAEVLPLDTVQRAFQDGAGFPSSHTATITIIILMIWPQLSMLLRFGVMAFVLLVGWSRIFLGVHFPLDIIGGFACALVVYAIYCLIPKKYLKRIWLD